MMTANDPNSIQLSIAALAKMIKFDLKTPGKETIGLLIGHEKDGVVFVEDVRLGDQKGNAVHVAVSQDELTQAAIEISEREDNMVIVGWIHTHPGLSAFMSGTDISTQKLYQSLMPNAIAIVVDPTMFGKTENIDDLDMKVFRVIDDKAVEHRYTITNTVEFGLNTFVKEEGEIVVHSADKASRSYRLPVPNPAQIRHLRAKIQSVGPAMEQEDVEALHAWLDLTEAIESGDVKEAPIEVERLMTTLDNSIGAIDNEINGLRKELAYRKAEKTLFAIFIGVILELSFFLFFL